MKKIVSFMLAIFMSIAVLQAPLTVYAESTNALQEPEKIDVFRVEIGGDLLKEINNALGTLLRTVHFETLPNGYEWICTTTSTKTSWEKSVKNMTLENWRTYYEGVTFVTVAPHSKTYYFNGPNVVSVEQQGNAVVAKLDVIRTIDFEVGTDGNVADKPGSIIQVNGTSLILPPMPDNNHYFCTGWKDGNTTYKVGEEITLSKDLTLTAMWEKYNQFEVKYVDGVDGLDIAVPTTKAYYTDETASAEDMIGSRPNYNFTGWKDSDDNTYKVGDTLPLTKYLVLTAQWEELAKYKVEYADGIDGLDIVVPEFKEDYVGKTITVANGIRRDNFDFDSWLGNDGNTYEAGKTITLEKDLVLTAVWQEHAKSLVEYAIGCDDSSITPPPPQEDYVGKTITVANGISRDNFDFKGWKGSNGTLYAVGDKITLIKDNLVLTAQWNEHKKYKVEYADGVDGVEIAVPTTQEDYVGKDIIVANAISRDNFDFKGWLGSSGTLYAVGDTITLTKDLVLTAKWEEHKKFKVEYADGAEGVEIAVPATQEDYIGKDIIVANAISRDNFNFKNWKDSDGNSYEAGKTITLVKDIVLKADWEEHAKFKVEYADGAEGVEITVPKTQEDYVGKTITVEKAISRDNFDFTGWKGNDGNTYAAGNPITLEKDLVLTAVWEEHAKFKVEYTIGCDDSSLTPPLTQEDYINNDLTLANGLTRDNFKFNGWKDADGTLYAGGAKIKLTKDLVLTAQWEELAKIKVTYADGVEGVEIAVPTTQEDYIGKDIALGNAISRENFDFAGWQDSDKKIYTAGQSIKLTQNLSLTATWKRQSIKVDQIQVILSDKRVNELAPGLWLVSEVHLEKGRGFDYTIVKRAEKEWFFNPKDVNYQNYDSKYSGITVLNTKLIKRPVYPFDFSDPSIRVTLKKDAQLYLNCKRTGSLLTIYLD